MTGVWNTTFQNALQSTSRIRLRHQSGPPPCSAPKTRVPALFDAALLGPLTLAEPVAASASAASTTPAKSQSLRRCDYFQDLLGDLCLARSVHRQRQVVDQLAGVLGGVSHRGHLGAVLARGRLE